MKILLLLTILTTPAFAQWGANSQPTRTTANHSKRVIGYVTQWDAWKSTSAGQPAPGFLNHLNLDYSQYTHLNFSFFGVANDGSLHSGDFRNPTIYQDGQEQSPAPLLDGDIYSSWDYWLVWGNLSPQWDINATVMAAGFTAYAGGWKHTATDLTGPFPVPYHPPGTAPGILELAHSKGVKVMASIGGWSMCKHFGAMAASATMRAKFIADCQRLISLGFDGIDFDWEYPGPFVGMNFTGTDVDYANYLILVQELRAAIGTGKEITAAMSCVPGKLAGFDWALLAPLMNSFDLMTYDIQGGWSDKAGHNAPLYAYTGEEGGAASCDTGVQYLIGRGVPRTKIAMGLGFYGRGVICSGSAALGVPTVKVAATVQPDGPIVTCADFATWAPFDATPTYEFIHQIQSAGWTRHWDDEAKVPYLTKGTSFLSYDDSRSIGLKADYVRMQGLGGVIVWHAYGDLRAGTITNPGEKLPFSPTTVAPLINVVNSVLAGDAVPADGAEGPTAPGGPPRGLDTLATTRPLVFGYLNALRSASGQDQVITDFPAAVAAANVEAFDLVVTAFAEPRADGTIGTGLGAFSSYLPAVVNVAHTLGKSVVVSIGGASPAALGTNLGTIAASATLRDTFANNIVAFLQANQLDGLDIDDEFPADATARTNFTLLMQTIYAKVKLADSRYIVMFGSGPGWYLGSFDFAALKDSTDFFFYFGYDWKNPANGPMRKPGTTQWTSANDQLGEASVKGGVDYVIGKTFPASKIIVGLPFYGSNNISWSAVRDTWAANQAGYLAAIDANSLEVQIGGEWFTTPDAMKRKMDALLKPTSSVLAGQAVVRGVGCWEIGHEHASHPDLSNAFAQWIASYSSGPPTLAIASASTVEGNRGTKTLTFTVTLSSASASAVTVNYATADGTATAGSDYTAMSDALTFAAGETSKTLSVTIAGDTIAEPDETFVVTLSGAAGATISVPTATGTILNDDAGPGAQDGWTSHTSVGGLTLTLQITDDWGSGFQGNLLLTNLTGTALTTWTIQFDAPFTISSTWDGVYGGKSGSTHTVSNPTWGGYSLANNATGAIGFVGSGTQKQPANLKLNGQSVGSGGTPFATWATAQGLPSNAPFADTDGDGAANIEEFLFTPSLVEKKPVVPKTEIRNLTVGGISADYFCLIVDVSTNAADAQYRVVACDDLDFTSGRVMVLVEAPNLGNGFVRAVWRDTAPLGPAARVFGRIEERMKP
jgi:GH18 family chitinase